MKDALKIACIALLAAGLSPLAALADTYDLATLVAITPASDEQVQLLYDAHVDLVGHKGNAFKALLSKEEIQSLSDQGFTIEILYDEMQEDRARWARAAASHTLTTSYYTPSTFNTVNPPSGSAMEHLLQQYNAHPTITRLYNLGASQDGAYDIIAMKVTKNPDLVEAEPKIRIYGNIHGDEQGAVMVTCDVLDTILAGYSALDPTATKLVNESEMWFIPIGNPYGNANFQRQNSRGIDLNRNFWGPAGSDAPPAWSEAETRAIRDLTEAATGDHSKKRFAVSLTFHEGETCFNSVWNYTTAAPTDEPIFWSSRTGGTGCGVQAIPNCPTRAPHGLAQAYADGCTQPGFWYTEGFDWYVTKGDTNDWAYGMWTQLDTTLELNKVKTPDPSEIPTYTAQHRQAVLNYMMKVFQGIQGVMTDQNTNAPLDGTVAVTATASSDIPVPHPYQAIYTDPVTGDFTRVLQPATYTMVCDAPGYMTTTVTGIVVTADTTTHVNCPMNPTGLKFNAQALAGDSCSGGGAYSGDAVLDPGESGALQVTLRNPGTQTATSVQGTISTSAPGVTITRATETFPNIPGGGTGTSAVPNFLFNVDPSVACGTTIPFTIHLSCDQGAWDDSASVLVGQFIPGTPVSLLSESFDGVTFPPTGWAVVDTNMTAGNWLRSTGTNNPPGGGTHSGAGLAYFNSAIAQNLASTRLYRTSGVSIPGSSVAAAVTFWMYHDTNAPTKNDRVQAQVSTNGTNWTAVGSAIPRYDGSTGWKQHTLALDAYIGQSSVQIGFNGISAVGKDCHIDDVQVTYTPPPTCSSHGCTVVPNADLAAGISAPASAPTLGNVTYSLGVMNNGPGGTSNVQVATSTPVKTTFVSVNTPAGWSCSTPAVGGTGPVSCAAASLAASASASLSMVVKVNGCAGNGATLTGNNAVSSASTDPTPGNDAASANTTVVDNGSCDDGNACTAGDACSGSTCIGGAPIGAPSEVSNQAFTSNNTQTWDDVVTAAPGLKYDVARGALGEWPTGTGGSETCPVQQTSAHQATIPDTVGAAGSGYWYLVRARTACGIGSYGTATGGAPRNVTACP